MDKAASINKLVSVILCNYNYGQFISEAIDSVLHQTYCNLELIIVDDGSTDNSRDVISCHTDPRIITVFMKNGGQAAAFNSGIEKANGEFIAFIDSDDAWTPDKLERTVAIMENENFSLVQHNLHVVDENSSDTGKMHPGIIPGRKNVLKEYARKNHTEFFSVTSSILCRKSDLDKIFPLDISWRICADVAITRPLPMFGNVCTLPLLLGYYRIHGINNWMNTKAQGRSFENAQREFIYVNYWLEKLGFKERLNFEISKYWKQRIVDQIPRYHPLRVMHTARHIVWSRIAYPLILKFTIRTGFVWGRCNE